MRIYTAHLHRRKAPVLVPEAFSWGALLFGPLWLLRHGAWIAAILAAGAFAGAVTALPPPIRPAAAIGIALLLGVTGQDLRRWHLRMRRFELRHIVAARDRDEALLRLLTHRSDLLGLAV